jgi:hypothetical protein
MKAHAWQHEIPQRAKDIAVPMNNAPNLSYRSFEGERALVVELVDMMEEKEFK